MNTTPHIRKTRGFTLIELLLYVAVSSVLLLSISFFLGTLVSSRIRNEAVSEVERQGALAMQVMTQTIRNSDFIASPATSTKASALTLGVSDQTKNPSVFFLSGGAIRISEGTADPVSLTGSLVSVSDLAFANMSGGPNVPGTVRIVFTVTRTNPSGRGEYDYSKTFIGSGSLRK